MGSPSLLHPLGEKKTIYIREKKRIKWGGIFKEQKS